MIKGLRPWLWTVPLLLLAGFLSARLSSMGPGDPWFDALRKPRFLPPPAVFPIVWSALYTILGFVLADLIEAGRRGRRALRLFLVQLVLNFAWSPLFFVAHAIGLALAAIVVLELAVLLTIGATAHVRRSAAWALVPYAAWLVLAAAVNFAFLRLNG